MAAANFLMKVLSALDIAGDADLLLDLPVLLRCTFAGVVLLDAGTLLPAPFSSFFSFFAVFFMSFFAAFFSIFATFFAALLVIVRLWLDGAFIEGAVVFFLAVVFLAMAFLAAGLFLAVVCVEFFVTFLAMSEKVPSREVSSGTTASEECASLL